MNIHEKETKKIISELKELEIDSSKLKRIALFTIDKLILESRSTYWYRVRECILKMDI